MDTTKHYRAFLYQCLAREYNAGQVESMITHFDSMANAGGAEMAFCVAMETYADENTAKAAKTVKDIINSELETFNNAHQGIETNPKVRIAKAVKTLNDNLDKIGIIFNGTELTKQELEKIKAKLPLGMREPVMYSATAASKDKKPVKFAISIAI